MERLFVYGMLLDVPGTRQLFGQESVTEAISATLDGWMLCCSGLVYATQRAGSVLPGAVLTVPTLEPFDRLEGYPHHYNRMIVHPVTPIGQTDAWVYYREDARDWGKIRPGYGAMLVRGYQAFGHDPQPIIDAMEAYSVA